MAHHGQQIIASLYLFRTVRRIGVYKLRI